MTDIEGFVRGLAEVNGATVSFREIPGNYPFPGQDTFGFVMIDDIPGVDVTKVYPHVRALGAGSRVFKVLHDNLAARGIARPEERRVGKECVSTGGIGGARANITTKEQHHTSS